MVRISQKELAAFVDLSRQLVNGTLRNLQHQGLVRLGRGTIVVLDHPRLLSATGADITGI